MGTGDESVELKPGRSSKRPPFQFSLRTLVIATIIAGILLGIGVAAYRKLCEFSRCRAWISDQYACAAVVKATTEYVEAHQGAWPTGWTDLKVICHPDFETRVRMNFAADPAKLARDEKLIFETIVPVSGSSILVERQLSGLKPVLMKHHGSQTDVSAPKPSP